MQIEGSSLSFSDTMAGEVLALWTSLRLIEEAAALRYQWGESKVYDRHLQALRMDLKLVRSRLDSKSAFGTFMIRFRRRLEIRNYLHSLGN